MASFHLYHADCIGNEKNCLYPHGVEVTDEGSLAGAVASDYVAVKYREGYRSGSRFELTDWRHGDGSTVLLFMCFIFGLERKNGKRQIEGRIGCK